jgi:hypothetical protein
MQWSINDAKSYFDSERSFYKMELGYFSCTCVPSSFFEKLNFKMNKPSLIPIYTKSYLCTSWKEMMERSNINYCSLTFPRLCSIPAEKITANFNQGNCWFLVVTLAVEGTGCPSISCCAPTQFRCNNFPNPRFY